MPPHKFIACRGISLDERIDDASDILDGRRNPGDRFLAEFLERGRIARQVATLEECPAGDDRCKLLPKGLAVRQSGREVFQPVQVGPPLDLFGDGGAMGQQKQPPHTRYGRRVRFMLGRHQP